MKGLGLSEQAKKVLIVEDYQAAAETFMELLQMLGCEAEYVMSGADAHAAVAKQDYAIVFMDLNLPDISGLALVNEMRAALPAERMPRFVAVSGFAQTDLTQENRDAFDFYLEKPLDIARLDHILQTT